MTDYMTYPKPSPDKTASRSAKPAGKAPMGGQKHVSGTMGKNQKTGDGMEKG